MTTRNTEKTRLQRDYQERFLKAYAQTGTILQAGPEHPGWRNDLHSSLQVSAI